jgi:hypothetical protein
MRCTFQGSPLLINFLSLLNPNTCIILPAALFIRLACATLSLCFGQFNLGVVKEINHRYCMFPASFSDLQQLSSLRGYLLQWHQALFVCYCYGGIFLWPLCCMSVHSHCFSLRLRCLGQRACKKYFRSIGQYHSCPPEIKAVILSYYLWIMFLGKVMDRLSWVRRTRPFFISECN